MIFLDAETQSLIQAGEPCDGGLRVQFFVAFLFTGDIAAGFEMAVREADVNFVCEKALRNA